MGLDQYLYEERYLSHYANLAEGNDHYRDQFERSEKILDLAQLAAYDDGGSVTVRSTAMYWRKANQIHKWFVDNVQGGADDCGTYDVSREQIETLRDLCQRILDLAETIEVPVENGARLGPDTGGKWEPVIEDGEELVGPARELAEKELPPTDGFFFGSTGYNQFYLADLQETVAGLTRVLDNQPISERGYPETEFYYSSSW